MADDSINVEQLKESQVSPNDNFVNFKVIIIGDSGVGKSSLLKRAVQNRFESVYQATIGFEFLLMYFKVKDMKIKLQIWDTCGQEMYRSLVQGFYRNTSFALIVYDVSQRKSFDNIETWLNDLRQNTEQDIPVYIVGNKIDLDKQVTTEEAKIFSVSNRTKYFIECSAKNGKNCNEIFAQIAKYLYNSQGKGNNFQNPERLKISNEEEQFPETKKKRCCKV